MIRLMLVLGFLPWIQGSFQLIKEQKLHGAVAKIENPSFNIESWFQDSFQKSKEEYLNSEFGFRTFFVRLNNQIDFSLFGKVHAKQVVRGKENYFYEYNYIPAYYGLDFIGEEKIESTMKQLKTIQDSLASRNKTFIFVMTASKGQFYPEYFPDSCTYSKSKANYEVYMQKAKDLGVNCIDFNSYFLSLKNNSKYPLYSKYGIHWTHYGACLATDSIIHYIEQNRNMDLPELSWDSVRLEPAHDDDRDIELGLNLLLPFEEQILAYPNARFENVGISQKPSAMAIADSYYWSLFNLNIHEAFSRNEFWYYYYKIYVFGKEGFVVADDLTLNKALKDFDVLILLGTDVNLNSLGWEFIEKAEEQLKIEN